MRCASSSPNAAALLLAISACAGGAAGSGSLPLPPLSPPPVAAGPLAIAIAYPREATRDTVGDTIVIFSAAEDRIRSLDSAFVFGSVGRGDARLAVNGVQIPVYPSGGWIAWLPLPRDSIARFYMVAVAGRDTSRATLVAPIQQRFAPPPRSAWIDTTTLSPAGMHWRSPGEGTTLMLRASALADVRLRFADGTSLPLLQDSGGVAGRLGRGGDTDGQRYVGWWAGRIGPDPGHVLSPNAAPSPDDPAWAVVEAVRDADTARARWPLSLAPIDDAPPPVVIINDDTAGTGQTDSSLAGRPSPRGTYNWFFPTGTVAGVSGRANAQIRLQLSQGASAWVDARDVQPLPPGTPLPRVRTGMPRLESTASAVTLRVPIPVRVPFRVDERAQSLTLELYGVAADMDRIYYGATDSLVSSIRFAQPRTDEAAVYVELTQAVWGYRAEWGHGELLLHVRRPPRIDPLRPLHGRRIALDPGHPPRGATGPTGAREPVVALAVARKAAELLRRLGAEAVLTRSADSAVGLMQRVPRAERADAELMVSIHADALPDGVNPFENHGTSVYYYHPRSVQLARLLSASLVSQFDSRDRGVVRGDLAVVRGTWFPSALTEGLFMMLPDQEAILTSEEGQWRYARGIVDGIEAYLRAYAERSP